MSRLRRADLALGVAALAALAGLGVALRPQHTATVAVAPSAAQIARPTVAAINRRSALVISDAYTAGSGLAEMSYGCKAATKMGWLCTLAAEPGTGYISGGAANRFPLDQGSGKSTSFGERIPALGAAYTPNVVILDGGRNDTFAPPSTRFEVTASTIWQAHQTWPGARIVFVKPRFLAKPGDDLGVTDDIIDLLKQYSGVPDLVVIDPIARFADTDTTALISRDGTDPSRAGEEALANALADELARTVMAPAT